MKAALFCLAVLAVGSSSGMDLNNRFVQNAVRGMMEKLEVLTRAGEDENCLTEEAEAAVCVGEERLMQMEEIAETCDVDVTTVRDMHLHPPTEISQENFDRIAAEQTCILAELQWVDANGDLIYENIVADLENSPIGANAQAVVDAARNMSGRVTWDSVDRFRRANPAQEDILMPEEPHRFAKNARNDDERETAEAIAQTMFFTLIKREAQTACLNKAMAELVKPASVRMAEDLMDNLVRKLRPLAESDSPLTPEAEEQVCVEQSLIDTVDAAATGCGIEPERVNYLGQFQSTADVSQEEAEEMEQDRECLNAALGWIDTDANGVETINVATITASLEQTTLGDSAGDVAQDCADLSARVDFNNVRTFARTGVEEDLTADPSGNAGPDNLTAEQEEQRRQLVQGVAEFVFFNCVRREFEAACILEANCQLENIDTLSDQCPVSDEPMAY